MGARLWEATARWAMGAVMGAACLWEAARWAVGAVMSAASYSLIIDGVRSHTRDGFGIVPSPRRPDAIRGHRESPTSGAQWRFQMADSISHRELDLRSSRIASAVVRPAAADSHLGVEMSAEMGTCVEMGTRAEMGTRVEMGTRAEPRTPYSGGRPSSGGEGGEGVVGERPPTPASGPPRLSDAPISAPPVLRVSPMRPSRRPPLHISPLYTTSASISALASTSLATSRPARPCLPGCQHRSGRHLPHTTRAPLSALLPPLISALLTA